MYYLTLNRVIGFYTLHCTSISWVVYMLGLYHVEFAYNAYFMHILYLLGKKPIFTKMSFYKWIYIFYA